MELKITIVATKQSKKKNIKNHKNVLSIILYVLTRDLAPMPSTHLLLAFSSTYLLLSSNP
jgi:hypothetical protein